MNLHARRAATLALPNRALPNRVLPNRALPNWPLPNWALLNRALPNRVLPNRALPNWPLPNRALLALALLNRLLPNRVLLALALLTLPALACHADGNWYKVEVLVFRQAAPTKEQGPVPRPAAYPADVTKLRAAPPKAAATAQRRGQERKHPPPQKPLDPVLAVQVVAAERAEAAQRLNQELNTPVTVPQGWAFAELGAAGLDLAAAAERLGRHPGYTVARLVGWVQPLDDGAAGTPVQLATNSAGPLGGYATLHRKGKLQLALELWFQDPQQPGLRPARPGPGPAKVPAPAPDNATPGAATIPAAAGDPALPAAPDRAAAPVAAVGGATAPARPVSAAPVAAPTAAPTSAPMVSLRDSVQIVSGETHYVDSPTLGVLVRVDLVSRPVAQRSGIP